MWAKRFPVPEFDRYALKNLDWSAPAVSDDIDTGEFGCRVVNAQPEFCEKFRFQGEHLQVVACTLPEGPVHVSGNSFAWPIHRAVMTDSLDPDNCNVIADWKTPRPMNTRLGPDDGMSVELNKVYLLIGHQYADNWIGNRIMLDNEWVGGLSHGFRVLSSSETEINDFHDAIVYFEWA